MKAVERSEENPSKEEALPLKQDFDSGEDWGDVTDPSSDIHLVGVQSNEPCAA